MSFLYVSCHSGLDPESRFNNAEILVFARMTKAGVSPKSHGVVVAWGAPYRGIAQDAKRLERKGGQGECFGVAENVWKVSPLY